MSSLLNKQIPPPASWEKFEDMCCDLWRLLWHDPNAQKNGRKGQAQSGVDVFGRPDEGSEWAGVQCKGKDNYAEKTLTEKELRDEVNKAKNFPSPIITKEYVLATTGLRDAKIQQVAREITQQHQKEGLFPVHVWFWEDIKNKFAEYPELIKKYYPDLYATTVGNAQIEQINAQNEQILEKLTAQQESQNKISEGVQRIEQNGGIQTEAIISGALKSEYEAELNDSRDLINEYKPLVALEFLNRLRDRIWSKADSNTRYRLLTNIGTSNIALDDIQEGAKCLIEALQYNSKDEKALLNAALGHIILEQREEAKQFVRTVLKRNPASSRAYSMLVQSKIDQPYETVLDCVPKAHRNSPEVAFELGKMAAHHGKLKEAKKWLERGIEWESADVIEIKIVLGFVLVEMLLDGMEGFIVGQIDEDTQSIIDRIIELFTEAWEKVKDTDLKFVKHAWVAQRGIIFRLKEEYEKAAKDLDIALELCPDNSVYKKFRAIIALESGDVQKAKVLFEELISSKQPGVVIPLADIYSRIGQSDDAIKILKDYIEQDPGHNLIEEVKRSLVYTYLEKGDLDNAEGLVNKMRAEDPTNILYLVVAAKILVEKGQKPDALSLLQEARNYALDTGSIRERDAVAEELQKLEQYSDAMALYENIADRTQYTPLTQKLLCCYYQTGELGQALEICQSILKQKGPPLKIIELAAGIQEELGNLSESRRLCERYLAVHPDDELMRLRKASLDFRTQAFDEVDRYLQSDIDTSQLDLVDILRLAEIYSARGHRRKTIDLLYETLRKHYNDGRAHEKYIFECLLRNQGDDAWLNATQADVDTAICVEDESGKRRWYVIEDREDVKTDRNEVQPGHKIAQQLLGKTVGEEIVLRDSPLGVKKGKIVEIKSKYVHAGLDSMENFETRFPDASGLHQLTIQGLDSDDQEYVWQQFEPILQQVKNLSQGIDNAKDIYKTGKITIGALADAVNRHPIDIWGSLICEEDVGIRCCEGNELEREAALKLLQNKNITLVIDLITLMNIYVLKIHDIVVETFGKLGIAQSTIDEIQQKIYEIHGMQGHSLMVMSYEKDQYIRREITEEELKRKSEHLENMIVWIRENCEVLPVSAAGNMGRNQRDELEKLLGKSFHDTVLLASETDKLLWSDDSMLRLLAEKEYNAGGIWTQIVLMKCQELNKLDNSAYQKKVIHLVLSNYRHTAINGDTLIEAARESKWQLDLPLDQILKTLSGKYCDEDSAIGVAVNFVYHLWQNPFIPYSRTIIFAVLDAITEERNRQAVLDKFMWAINSKFSLLPFEKEKTEETVQMWRRSHAHDLIVSV